MITVLQVWSVTNKMQHLLILVSVNITKKISINIPTISEPNLTYLLPTIQKVNDAKSKQFNNTLCQHINAAHSKSILFFLIHLMPNILIEFGIPMKQAKLLKMCLTETYSRVQVGKNLPHMFPIRNGLKQGDTLSPFFFNFALEYAIRRV
jgi:hypothetical protein